MISFDPNARPPRIGEPLVAVRPVEAEPDTPPESGDGATWRWFSRTGYPIAYAYLTPVTEHEVDFRAEISNEAPELGLDGLIVGWGNPSLPRTKPEHDPDEAPISYAEIVAEVEATLRESGWSFVERRTR